MGFLSVEQFQFGYCTECRSSTVVARLRLTPWRHGVTVCASCLRVLAGAIDMASVALAGAGPELHEGA